MERNRASTQIAELAGRVSSSPGVRLEFPRPTDASDRVLGTELAGAIARARIYDGAPEGSEDSLAELDFNGGSVAGQGFGAFNAGASRFGSRAVPRTASARRCWAEPSRS